VIIRNEVTLRDIFPLQSLFALVSFTIRGSDTHFTAFQLEGFAHFKNSCVTVQTELGFETVYSERNEEMAKYTLFPGYFILLLLDSVLYSLITEVS
jgi:hypothetical protein